MPPPSTPDELAELRAARRERVRQRLATELDASGILEAPWVRFPHIRAGSIGWRMGPGESWMELWWSWRKQLVDIDARIAALQGQSPAPMTWRKHVVEWVRGEVEEPHLAQRLEDDGVFGLDVSFPQWLCNLGPDGIDAPWEWRGATVYKVLRYRARTLGFWARWAAARSDDERAAWLVQHPASSEWSTVTEAFTTRIPPEVPSSTRSLVCMLAAQGALAPPWIWGAKPALKGRRGSLDYSEAASLGAQWAWWVTSVFEDLPTWRAYLASWSQAPPEWSESMDESFPWITGASRQG